MWHLFKPFSALLLLIVFSGILPGCQNSKPDLQKSSPIEALSATDPDQGFARATEPRTFTFPADAGPHPEYQTEWWYYTGNLEDATGRDFGYQLTFFRRALSPAPQLTPEDWPTQQVYFAHFTVSDMQNKAFYPFERWQRGSIDLAGAQSQPFKVWLDHWQISGNPEGEVILKAHAEGVELDLKLNALKPVVLEGDKGLSQKSSGEGNASYYYSRTRIASEGTLKLPEQERMAVKGLSWLDREWSTSVLSREQSGWDWFSLHFDNGEELMLYQLRLKAGGVDNYSSGTHIAKDGSSTHLEEARFEIKPTTYWTSEATGIRYPAGWELSVQHPGQIPRTFQVKPLMNNQELPLSFVYWEGAVEILDTTGKSLGKGYVELTGYDRP